MRIGLVSFRRYFRRARRSSPGALQVTRQTQNNNTKASKKKNITKINVGNSSDSLTGWWKWRKKKNTKKIKRKKNKRNTSERKRHQVMLSSAMDRLSHRLSHSFRVAESLAHPSAGANSRESILGELERARRGDSGPSNVASALPASSSSSSSALSSAFSFSSPNLSSLSPSSSFGGSSGRRARSSRSQSYATDKFESSTTSAAGLSARLAALSATHSSAVVVGSGNLDQLFSEPMTQHYDDQVALSEGATSSVKSVFPNIAARLCKLSRVRAKLLERDKPTQRPMRKMVTHLAGSSQEQQIASPDPQNARALFRQAVVDSSVGAPKLPALGSPVGNESITSVAASQSFATSGSHVRTGLCRNAEGGGDQDTARLPEVAPGRGPRLTLKLIRGEFRKFDTDGNQLLDAMEFKHFISSLHPNLKPARWAECKRRFARWDKDGSGFLDFEEFVSLYEDTFGPLPRNEHDVVPSDQDEDDGDLDRNDVPSRSVCFLLLLKSDTSATSESFAVF